MRPPWLSRPPAPRPDPPDPAASLLNHEFQPWTVPSTGKVICIRLVGRSACGRPEHEHAPASTSSETGA